VNNKIPIQNISNNYEFVVLMPKILGDAIMSVQALHCYSELIESNLLIITDSIYQNLFSLITLLNRIPKLLKQYQQKLL
jgi:hypothetical protein